MALPTDHSPSNSSPVLDRLRSKLESAAIPFELLRHAPVYTSEQAAAVRGTALSSGAKALLLKLDDRFAMFVLPADRKLDSRKVRRAASCRSSRFATADEVFDRTGLRPGSIPPFGSLFGLTTYCDPALGSSSLINFNAGDHSVSISMLYADYIRSESPCVAEFAADPG